MRIEVLEYFLEISECESFSRASDTLYISQQGLSKSMRALERELGVILFRKNGRKIELTEEGAILKQHATKIVRQNDALRECLFERQVSSSELNETVSVYATSYVCNAVYNLLDSELSEYGLDNCLINECELNEIITALERGETTFGLVNILEKDVKQLEAYPYLRFTPFLAMEITVKASKSIASRFPGGTITMEQLSKLPLAHFNEPVLNRFVERIFKESTLECPTLVLHSTNIGRINSLVQSSKAVTFSDTFTYSAGQQDDNIPTLVLEPLQRFYVGVLESPALKSSVHQYAYVRQLLALIKFKHRHYLSKHAVFGETFPIDCGLH